MTNWKLRLGVPALIRLGWSCSCVTGCISKLAKQQKTFVVVVAVVVGLFLQGIVTWKKANLTCQTYLQQILKPSISQSFDIWRAVVSMVTKLKGDTANSTFCSFRHFLYIRFIAMSKYFHSNGSQMPVLNIWNQLQLIFIIPVVMRLEIMSGCGILSVKYPNYRESRNKIALISK